VRSAVAAAVWAVGSGLCRVCLALCTARALADRLGWGVVRVR
jgi:hypothetical protein